MLYCCSLHVILLQHLLYRSLGVCVILLQFACYIVAAPTVQKFRCVRVNGPASRAAAFEHPQ